ncbi:MAG: hypothetical protein WAM91_00595 [Candidatus Acidiferrales bacterium]
MRRLMALISVVAILSAAPVLVAKQKNRNWQSGKLIGMKYVRVPDGQVHLSNAPISGTVGDDLDPTFRYGVENTQSQTASAIPAYRHFEAYEIETTDSIYVCRENIKYLWSKPAKLTVNDAVQFAIDGGHIYIKSADGSVHNSQITKRFLKLPQR